MSEVEEMKYGEEWNGDIIEYVYNATENENKIMRETKQLVLVRGRLGRRRRLIASRKETHNYASKT